MRLSNTQRASVFGQPGKVKPVAVTTAWGVRTQCHPAIAPLFLEACDEAARVSKWKPRRIDGYNPRKIEGTSSWSIHSWALAWDFFATPPGVAPPGGVWTPKDGMPADFAACFERRGFTWGARFTRKKDTPHIEWAGALPRTSVKPPKKREGLFMHLTEAEEREILEVARWLKATLDKNADGRMESIKQHVDLAGVGVKKHVDIVTQHRADQVLDKLKK